MRCGRVPFPLHACPTCGGGYRPSRAWRWVEPKEMLSPMPESNCGEHSALTCMMCPMNPYFWERGAKAGLIWIGEAHYPAPQEFMREALEMGVSRRIAAIPRGFRAGTGVFLAHKKAVPPSGDVLGEDGFTPGIFTFFRAQRIEYVVRGDETPDKIERLHDRGVQIVRVHPIRENQENLPGMGDE